MCQNEKSKRFFILLIYYFPKSEKGVLMMAQFIPGRLSADHQQRVEIPGQVRPLRLRVLTLYANQWFSDDYMGISFLGHNFGGFLVLIFASSHVAFPPPT